MQDLLPNIFGTLVALAFVLGLAWLLILGWRRMQDFGSRSAGAGEALRFVRALPVGSRERVVLLDHAGERWMLGVTAGGISLLARWPLPAQQPPGGEA